MDDKHRILALSCDDIGEGFTIKQMTKERTYECLHKYLQRGHIRNMWMAAEHFFVESQMKGKMIAIEGYLVGYFRQFGRVQTVSPVSWRKWFKIGTGNYEQNKAASVRLCETLIQKCNAYLPWFAIAKKRDDMCEAVLIAEHGLSKHVLGLQTSFIHAPLLSKPPDVSTLPEIKRKRKRDDRDPVDIGCPAVRRKGDGAQRKPAKGKKARRVQPKGKGAVGKGLVEQLGPQEQPGGHEQQGQPPVLAAGEVHQPQRRQHGEPGRGTGILAQLQGDAPEGLPPRPQGTGRGQLPEVPDELAARLQVQ
jgi:hypothetical protein